MLTPRTFAKGIAFPPIADGQPRILLGELSLPQSGQILQSDSIVLDGDQFVVLFGTKTKNDFGKHVVENR
jgi:hypothetical protein